MKKPFNHNSRTTQRTLASRRAYLPLCSFWRVVFAAFLIMQLTACAHEDPVVSNDGFAISNIQIKLNGATISSRPNMIDVCKGFILTRQQVQDYFVLATLANLNADDSSFNILPCFVSGTAQINNAPYKWTIHAGGLAEFETKTDKFMKICGKNCCTKIAGVC
jgi:hypothetical protein